VSLLALEALDLLETSIDQLGPTVAARFDPRPSHTERYRAALERQRRLYDALVVQ
jgi:hypothetical protein